MNYVWNGNWNDLEQVANYLSEFEALHAQILAAGQYPYNDSFRGLIPGIAGEWENRAIYLLQGLRRARIMQAKVDAMLESGYMILDSLKVTTKYSRVVVWPQEHRMQGEWREWNDARVMPTPDGKPNGVLAKGKRKNGTYINGRKVLVLK